MRNATLLCISLVFYAWGAPEFVFILLASTYIDFHLVKFLAREEAENKRKAWLSLSILLNLGLLAYFKYAGFFVENLSYLLHQLGIGEPRSLSILLPIGISFYTFQTLTYSIDVYRKEVKPLERSTDYLLYIFLFPQMIAGPIVRFSSIAQELRKRQLSLNFLSEGMNRFSIGLAKKVLLANPCGAIADQYMNAYFSDLSSSEAWIALLAYTFQIYFDFSGYSDMAIGLGKILGFSFPENFNRPYISKSITEFWRRWHITLGAWMRDYLYIPLGGNKGSKRRTFINLWLVFLASGLWHGASWNFVIWGAFHGLLLVIERAFRKSNLKQNIPAFMQVGISFFLVMMAWVVFRIEEFPNAMDFYQALFSFNNASFIALSNFEVTILILATLIIFGPWQWLKEKNIAIISPKFKGAFRDVQSLALLFISLIWLVSGDFNPFIYFRF